MINPCKQNHPCATRKQKGESRNSYGMRHKRVQSFVNWSKQRVRWQLPGDLDSIQECGHQKKDKIHNGQIKIVQVEGQLTGILYVTIVGIQGTSRVIVEKGKDVSIAGILRISRANFPNENRMVGPQTNKNRKIRPKSRLIPLLVSQTRSSGKGGACHRCLKFSPNWFSSSYS
jgi:hypothetical protein